jgi:integrase
MAVIPVKGRDEVFDVVVWTKPTDEAPRRRVTYRVAGLTKARKRERDLLHRRDEGLPLDKPQTLGEFIDEYLDSRRHEVRSLTLAGYKAIVARYIAPTIGKRKLTDVKVTTVRKFYSDLTDRGLAPRTVAGVHRVLSMSLKAAMVDGLIPRNPCQVARPQKVDDSQKPAERGLQPDEAKKLLEALQGTPVYAPAALALLTGLRRGEMLALKWEDVDVKWDDRDASTGDLHVRAGLEQVGSVVTRQAPKTKRSTRTVPLSPAAIAILRRHRTEQAALRLKWGVFWHDEGYVFPSPRVTQSQDGGRVWTPDAFAQAFRKAVRAKDKDLRVGFHDLRHTYATVLLAAGIRIEEVSRRLGHSSSVVTANVYSHPLDDEHRDGVEVLDGLL